jgi:hypothetical protein
MKGRDSDLLLIALIGLNFMIVLTQIPESELGG